jgi:hypothetical protein
LIPGIDELGEEFELGESTSGGGPVTGDPVIQAVLHVILDQHALGAADRAFDSVQLLGQLRAWPAALDHSDDRGEMTVGPFQAFNDMACVPHSGILSPGRDSATGSI